MTWIRLDYSLREDPRIADLADILDVQIRESFGIVTALYSWAVEHAPTRDVSSIRPRSLARATWWDESSAADLIAALADAGIVRDGAIVGWKNIRGLDDSTWLRNRARKIAAQLGLMAIGRCSYCGATGVRMTVDHVVPLSRGGGNEPANLVAACRPCNSSKGSKTLEEWAHG